VTDIRAAFDFVSGYKPYHVPDSILAESPLPIERLRREGKILSDRQWLLRIIVLESVAGVPGMVGGTLRHLRSLRLLVRSTSSAVNKKKAETDEQRRDGGWIHTLLEEAENERMHLL
jgi:ubiquinol oxidase